MLSRLRRHPWRNSALLVAVAAAFAFALGSVGDWVAFAWFAARAGSLAAIPAGGPTRTVGWTFPYRGVSVTIRADVHESALEQERSLPTGPVFMSGGSLRDAYMTTLVRTQAATPLIDDIARRLRAERSALRLDSDEYVEFVAQAVQSIPYGDGGEHVRPAAEMLADGRGVCTDKSVLLAALLYHEGYDTALWVFDTQGHVAVGVHGAGPGLHGTGYAFVETTRPSYIGETDGRYLVVGAGTRPPQLVHVGGTERYYADVQSALIVQALAEARMSDLALAPYDKITFRGDSYWARTYASLAEKHVETSKYAAWLASGYDRRAEIFASLVGEGSSGAGRPPSAAVR